MGLIQFTSKGLYCAAAGVHIDPWQPVELAIITHAHSDHARVGMGAYLCHHESVPLLRYRLGPTIRVEGAGYGEVRTINGVRFSLHPAGHMVGSAQVRVEHGGEVWVVSGDYKIDSDRTCTPFEPVRCDTFITECTFGLPAYRWPRPEEVYAEINAWWRACQAEDRCALLTGYSLGKAQHLLAHVDAGIGPIFTHGAVASANEAVRIAGVPLPPAQRITPEMGKALFRKALVIAPPSAVRSPWARRLGPLSTAFASGWMRVRGARRRRSVDRGFTLSDHADWDGLNSAVRDTGAQRVITTHGYTGPFSQWLREQGIDAHAERTLFKSEGTELEPLPEEKSPGT
jgi:putative mRNA 3-end processing factor